MSAVSDTDRRRLFFGVSPEFVATLIGFSIFLPVPMLRGTLFCQLPAVFGRTWRIAVIGGVLGAVTDLALTVTFGELGWNSREFYCEGLTSYFPPLRGGIASPAFSPVPNHLNFILGLVVWMNGMFVVWYWLTPGPKSWQRYGKILAIGVVCTTCSGAALWWGAKDSFVGNVVVGDSRTKEALLFLSVFLSATCPTCALIGSMIGRTAERPICSPRFKPADRLVSFDRLVIVGESEATAPGPIVH